MSTLRFGYVYVVSECTVTIERFGTTKAVLDFHTTVGKEQFMQICVKMEFTDAVND
jgi:hypothetical protein